jgi:phospholipase/carboxylesterase
MAALPGVQTGHSHIAPPGSRALRLRDGGLGVAAFMVGREFAHLHPAYDGSLHMTLDPAQHAEALAAGWAERHPLAGRFAPSTTVMVYGPRDAAELETVMQLVERSMAYARGDLAAD